MVEAIEDNFIPVLIYNNKEEDAKILKQFKEPSWNNPVTRFLNADLGDVIDRQDRVWTTSAMASRMVAALKAADRDVPAYLELIAERPARPTKATFAMHCYWEGEGNLGRIAGVSNTHSAWIGNLEVVEVEYDPEQVSYEKLVTTAQSMECASKVFAHSDDQLDVAKKLVGDKAVATPGESRAAKLSDQKYYLRNTKAVRHLPLTQLQSTKINARLGRRANFDDLLSPRQKVLLEEISKKLRAGSANDLNEFIFPEDDSQLADYETRLIKSLKD